MRDAGEPTEALLNEAKPFVAAVGRALRQVRREERLEQANPGEADEPEGHGDVVVAGVAGAARGPVGDPAERAQQRQLVGRRLVVVEDDVAEQRQRPGAVVGQPDGDVRPGHAIAAEAVAVFAGADDQGAVRPRQALDLGGGARVHGPARRRGAVPQRQSQEAARLEQRDELAEGTGPLAGRHVHPHGAQQNQVEGEPEAMRRLEAGQAVVEPADARVRVAARPLGAHGPRRLDRDDLVAAPGEPGDVAARAGADVEDQSRLFRHEVEQPGVRGLEGQALVQRRERARIGVIARDRSVLARHGRRPRPPRSPSVGHSGSPGTPRRGRADGVSDGGA